VCPGGKARIVRGVVRERSPDLDAWTTGLARRSGEALQVLRVRVGREELTAENVVTGSPVNDRLPDIGDEVLIRVRELGNETYTTLRELGRDRWLVRYAGTLALIVCVVFGRRGRRAICALGVSLLLMAALPYIMLRLGAVLAPTLAIAGLALLLTYTILCGFSPKTLGAAAGATLGITIGGVLALVAVRLAGHSGLQDADLAAAFRFGAARELGSQSLLACGILLGTLGVVMDVAIAVASAVTEVADASPGLDPHALRSAGMSVGRKVMGAMVMALCLAYLGLRFGLFLLLYVEPGTAAADVLGTERVTVECALSPG
jgi:uncharacterized membrane protein